MEKTEELMDPIIEASVKFIAREARKKVIENMISDGVIKPWIGFYKETRASGIFLHGRYVNIWRRGG